MLTFRQYIENIEFQPTDMGWKNPANLQASREGEKHFSRHTKYDDPRGFSIIAKFEHKGDGKYSVDFYTGPTNAQLDYKGRGEEMPNDVRTRLFLHFMRTLNQFIQQVQPKQLTLASMNNDPSYEHKNAHWGKLAQTLANKHNGTVSVRLGMYGEKHIIDF